MNAVNRVVTSVFDVLLAPLEAIGDEFALLVVSGVFGVLALWAFKHISWQRGIKATKDRIKGHLMEIRLYQDDLGIVAKATGKVLLRNLQYLGLNLLPFVPLSIPFVFVAAQMVVRYGFEPVPVQAAPTEPTASRIAGEGQTLVIEGAPDAIAGLEVSFPPELRAVSPLVRVPRQGTAAIEFVATAPGSYEIGVGTGASIARKAFSAGSPEHRPRTLQDRRVTGLFDAMLWPAEETLAGTGLSELGFRYPESDLGWLPFSGPVGVLIVFVVASMVIGFLFLKPLGVQI